MRSFKFIFVFAFLAIPTATVTAQEQSKLPFFLPVSSQDYPNIQHRMDAALFAAGLGQFSTQTTDYWHNYQQGIKLGRTGIYLAAPHFAAWAQHQHRFTALLKLQNKIEYVVASRSRDIDLFAVDDLDGRSVCTQSRLNLDSILLNQAFSNPLFSANNIVVSDVAKEIRNDNKQCQAFALANHLFLKHNLAHPESLIRLQQGKAWPPYAWIMHPDLTSKQKAMEKFLQSENAMKILLPVMQNFSNGERLIKAKQTDYPSSVASPLFSYWGALKR